MQAFEDYILKEYNTNNVACTAFKYTHAAKDKIDKKSKVPIVNNVITVKIDCYDDKHNLLASHSEKFIDGSIQRSNKNKLVNIAPAELNNRFAAAKQTIANKIMSEYLIKLKEINEKIDTLNSYVKVSGIIPTEFVNEPIIAKPGTTCLSSADESKTKKQFEF